MPYKCALKLCARSNVFGLLCQLPFLDSTSYQMPKPIENDTVELLLFIHTWYCNDDCRDSLLYEQWATTRDLSWMRLMKRRMCVRAMRSKLRSTKARIWEGSSVVEVDKRIV